MKNIIILSFKVIVIFSTILINFSCTSSPNRNKEWMAPNGKIKVLATIAMIEDIVKGVGGDYIDVVTLVKGDLNPHAYQLVKGDDEKLSYAQLIFYNGLGLEHGPSLHQYLENSNKAVSLGDYLRKKNPSFILRYNGSIDPHIWMDMSLWANAVDQIVESLQKVDPDHAIVFEKNGKELKEKLLAKHEELRLHMHSVPESKRYLITSHDAFNYFARAYLATDEELKVNDWQKRFAAPEGLAPDSQLSTTDIKLILDHMKKYRIQVIFPESNVSRASIQKLLDAGQENGMRVIISSDYLYGDAMGRAGSEGDTYEKMIQYNVNTLVKHLMRNE